MKLPKLNSGAQQKLARLMEFVLDRPFLVFGTLYALLAFVLIAVKYQFYLYNSFDLAIFHNALLQPWSNLLYSTLQGHEYFGDHLSLYLIPMKIIHGMIPSPITLLVIQVATIAAAGIPLTKLTKDLLPKKLIAILAAVFFLNPATMAITLNEYHPLTLVLPLLFTAFYYFHKKNWHYFVVWFLLAMVVREDVALTLVAFTPLALLERRKFQWFAFPLLSLLYFFAALHLSATFLGGERYAFLAYYDWLGGSLGEIAMNSFARSGEILARLANIYVLEFILGGLMLFFFLPLRKPRYLLFALFPYLVLVLGPGQGFDIFRFHYAVPIIAALTISSAFALREIWNDRRHTIQRHAVFIGIAVAVALIYLNAALGPYTEAMITVSSSDAWVEKSAQDEIVLGLDKDVSTLSSYQYLHLTPTRETYPLAYAYTGEQQFSLRAYEIPDDLQQAILNYDDLLNYSLRLSPEDYAKYSANLREVLRELTLVKLTDTYALYKRTGTQNAISLVQQHPGGLNPEIAIRLNDNISFIGADSVLDNGLLQTRIDFRAHSQPTDNYALKIIYLTDDLSEVVRYYPLTYGLYPSSLWKDGEDISVNFRLLLPKTKSALARASLQLVTLEGAPTIGPLSSAQLTIDREITQGKSVTIFDFSAE